jgi:hypothetical protein
MVTIKRKTKIQQGDGVLKTTIPLTVVEWLKLQKGDTLEWELDTDKATIKKRVEGKMEYNQFINTLENDDVVTLFVKLSTGKYISYGEYTVEGNHLIKFGGTKGVGDVYFNELQNEFDKVERPTAYADFYHKHLIQQDKPYIFWERD